MCLHDLLTLIKSTRRKHFKKRKRPPVTGRDRIIVVRQCEGRRKDRQGSSQTNHRGASFIQPTRQSGEVDYRYRKLLKTAAAVGLYFFRATRVGRVSPLFIHDESMSRDDACFRIYFFVRMQSAKTRRGCNTPFARPGAPLKLP